MGYIAGTLSLVLCYCVYGVTCFLEESETSSSPFSLEQAEYTNDASKNCSVFTGLSGITSLNRTRKDSGVGNISLEIISLFKLRSVDQKNETFDGFEFVDSPDIPPHSTDKPEGGAGVVHGDLTGRDRSFINADGAINKNLWKTYPNGTIIHDVHISLVHPANMAIEGVSGAAESKAVSSEGRMITDIKGRGGASAGFGVNSVSRQDATITGTSTSDLPRTLRRVGNLSERGDASASVLRKFIINNSTLLDYSSRTSSVFKAYSLNATILSSSNYVGSATTAMGGIVNASSFPSGRTEDSEIKDEMYPPVINVGISIDAKGPCLSDCMTKCYMAESNFSLNQASKLPLCLPPLFNSTTGGDAGFNVSVEPLRVDSTPTALVLVTQFEGGSDIFGKMGILKSDVASGIEIGMLKTKEPTEPKIGFLLEDVCLSERCILKAADILRRMDRSANPCDSFYKFACGGYFKNDLPDGEPSRSVFSDIASNIIARMYSVIKSPINVTDYLAVKLLKKFYRNCILTSQKELFMNALQEIGGWPSPSSMSQRVPQHIWGEIAFNMTYGMFLEYNLVSINLTFANESDRWMLNADYPQFVKVALNSGSLSVLDEVERDIQRVAAALGVDNIKSGLIDLRMFMASAIKYAKATMSLTAERGIYSLKDLKVRFVHLDVFKRLPSLLKASVLIDDNEKIHVGNMMYLKKVDELIRDSTVRTQESYLMLMVLGSLSSLIGTDNSLEKYCVKLTGKLFPHFAHHLYSSTFVSNSKVASATRILSHIRDGFLNVLNKYVDETIKNKVIDKVGKLKFIWTNRKIINDDLNGIAAGFDENPSFLGFVKTGIRSLKMAMYTYLHKRVNDSLASFIERYSEDDHGVNAFYYDGTVFIPPSALHESIFDLHVPPYVSYSGLGLIVGHELIHSVIEVGDFVNSANYRNMEKCIINHFDQYKTEYSRGQVNGMLTKEDNIADYGGFKVAYHAFMEWFNHSLKESKEKRLPGLQTLNEKQMFWVTAATNWCRKVPTGFVPSAIDKHAPPEYRIDGQFSNIPEFAKDFKCPENSPMNPKEKCSLW